MIRPADGPHGRISSLPGSGGSLPSTFWGTDAGPSFALAPFRSPATLRSSDSWPRGFESHSLRHFIAEIAHFQGSEVAHLLPGTSNVHGLSTNFFSDLLISYGKRRRATLLA